MSITLHLKPEVEAGLLEQAEASGVALENYLVSVLEGAVTPSVSKVSPEQRAVAFEARSTGHRLTPLLSDYAVSREGIYDDSEP